MPFSSEKQRRYLFANEPKIAHAWSHGRSSVTGRKEPPSQRGKRKSRPSKRGGRRTR